MRHLLAPYKAAVVKRKERARLAWKADPQLDHIPGLQVLWRLHSQPNPSGSSGADHIARKQRHELGQIGNQGGDIKNHLRRGTVLPGCAIHLQPHFEIAGIGNLVASREKRAQRSKCVAALAFHPLPPALKLKTAFRIIVVQDVSGHVIEGFVYGDIDRSLAHYNRKLDFPVHLGGIPRNHECIVWSD